jgi:copper transport protein
MALAGGLLLATAAPAWAHATLLDTNPVDRSTVAQSPSQVTLTYNENVAISLGSITVYDSNSNRVDAGPPHHASSSDHTVIVSVPQLKPGTYVVVWRVISADSHPVSGAFTFNVIRPSVGGGPNVQNLLNKTGGNETVGVIFGIARFFVYAGIALLLGGAVFYVLIARGTSAAARAMTVTWVGWGTLVVATIVSVMLQGPYGAGTGLGDAFKWKFISDVLHQTYGQVAERRLILLLLALPLLIVLQRTARPAADDADHKPPLPWWWIVSGVIIGLGIAATPGLAGHAHTGDWTLYAEPLDTLHVAAMSVWLGGLVALVACALGGGFSGGLRRALIIFSRLAFWCVVTLVLTGLFASWRQVGFTIRGYTDTAYGHLLLIKLAIFGVLIALAAISRSVVRARRTAPLDAPDSVIAAVDEDTRKKLRRSVGAEVIVAVFVLAVTAMLVNAQPARSALTPGIFSKNVVAGSPPMRISVTVDPAKAGPNTIHIYTENTQGESETVRDMTATLSLDSKNIHGLPANLTRGGANHFLVTGLPILPAGKWTMTLHVVRGGLNDTATVITIPIR